MQIPIVSGIYSDENAEFRTSYPKNMTPVPKSTGISTGYLKPSDGVIALSTNTPGRDRGGINWRGVCYRVMGSKLISVDRYGSINIIGDVGDNGKNVSMDYSFDYLAVASNTNLFLYNGSTLSQVTDSDLGIVLDVVWVDGYFMTTDGESLVVTELNDPFSVNPLKYGSSEADPDDVVALKKIKNEVYAINRHTIEVFDNVGGSGFPFSRVEGAQIEKGCIGTRSVCVADDMIALVGSGINESPSVYLGLYGNLSKVGTREIDEMLQSYTEDELKNVVCEHRKDKSHSFLYIHLPDRSIVYDMEASRSIGINAWHVLSSSVIGYSKLKYSNMVWCYDKWFVGDPTSNRIGYLSNTIASHYGDDIGFEFITPIIYNKSKGAIFHSMELVGLPGRSPLGDKPVVWASYSLDGETWSDEKSAVTGKQGDRGNRVSWRRCGIMRNYRMQKFRGTSDSRMSFSRLEAELEPLNV